MLSIQKFTYKTQHDNDAHSSLAISGKQKTYKSVIQQPFWSI